jgi:hypothetical protein
MQGINSSFFVKENRWVVRTGTTTAKWRPEVDSENLAWLKLSYTGNVRYTH